MNTENWGIDEDSWEQCSLCDGIGYHDGDIACDECRGEGEKFLTEEEYKNKLINRQEMEVDLRLEELKEAHFKNK
jgi:DnaJ-class molecular chaperone